jgi:TRAP-type mannitol/chloroaromatic compound transport system substrate-binding protein
MSEPTRTGTPPITEAMRADFLAKLSVSANVSASAKAAGFARRTAYDMRDRDPAFAQAWDEALAESLDKLREVAFEISTGVDKPVVSGGRIVFVKNEAGEMVPLMDRVVDSQTLRFLLQAHDASYRPAPQKAAAEAIPAELLPDPDITPDEPGPAKPIL